MTSWLSAALTASRSSHSRKHCAAFTKDDRDGHFSSARTSAGETETRGGPCSSSFYAKGALEEGGVGVAWQRPACFALLCTVLISPNVFVD